MAAAAAPACVVCGDVAPADACLACARGHVLCGECLNGLARAALAPDTVREAGGVVRCPWRGQVGAGRVEQCAAPPWTHATLAPLLTRETSAAVSAAALAALDVAAAEAARVREELAAAGARGGGVAPAAAAAAAGGGEGRAERMARYRRTVIDDVLTLRCPRCRLAFVDYQVRVVARLCSAGFHSHPHFSPPLPPGLRRADLWGLRLPLLCAVLGPVPHGPRRAPARGRCTAPC